MYSRSAFDSDSISRSRYFTTSPIEMIPLSLPGVGNRKMPEFSPGHPFHDLTDRIGFRTRLDFARHYIVDGLVAKLAVTGVHVACERAHDVAFGQDTEDLILSVCYHDRPDTMLVKNFDRIAKARGRVNRYDSLAFCGQNGFDRHGAASPRQTPLDRKRQIARGPRVSGTDVHSILGTLPPK
jgi:hypothetical protein